MKPAGEAAAYRRVLAQLEQDGLLMLADTQLPSVASLVAGKPIRGSWWAHPRAHAIARVAGRLDAHRDVADAKLISGKVTLIHRRLWPALVGVGSAHEPWQVGSLPRPARALLARVKREGRLRTDRLPGYQHSRSKAVVEAARELERRLLVHGEEFHTETGAHAKWLETWEHWAQQVRLKEKKMLPAAAKRRLEKVVRALNARYVAECWLPWNR